MDHEELEVLKEKNGKFYFQLKDDENRLIFKSRRFDSLHDCHEALIKVKNAAANTHLRTTI